MQFDETGPNTHTRRYWVSATVGIAAMIVFAILSILLLLGMVFGSPRSSRSPIRCSPGACWSSRLRASRCSLRTRVLPIRLTQFLHATDLCATRVRRCPHARIKLGA